METLLSAQFRVRLRIRLAKALNSTNTCEILIVSGREVKLKAEEKDAPLSEATWVQLLSSGFQTEAEARAFGEVLRKKVEIASFASRLGADVGIDETTTWCSEEWALSLGLIQPGERLLPNIHGVTVMPDDDLNRIPFGSPKVTVRADPAQLLGAIAELPDELPTTMIAANGIRLLNLALMTNEPLAQIVLAFSAVEELGQDEDWTDEQRNLLEELEQQVRSKALDAEHAEVADALHRSLHRVGLRQGVMRVLSRLHLTQLRKDWDRLYGLRSGLFHGAAKFTTNELNELALEAVTLCGKVLLAQLRRDGVEPPSISSTHFPD